MPLVAATDPGPASIAVGKDAETDPDISLKVLKQPGTVVHRMTGVETDTYVNVPTVSTLSFTTAEMCQAAIATLQKQSGVYSVSCVQTQ
jgi:hypothetical protein